MSVAVSTVTPSRSASCRKLRSIRSPRTGPGDRLLTVMPSGPTSAASVVVRPMTAILDAQYGVRLASGRLPLTEARLITSPDPLAIIGGRNARQIRYMPRTLTANTSSHSSGSISMSGATGPATPALLTRIEIDSSASSSRSASTETGSARSTTTVRIIDPAAAPSAAVSSRVLAVRPMMTTRTPAALSADAIALPRPFPPPETSAVRPARRSPASATWPGPAEVVIAPRKFERAILGGAHIARSCMPLEQFDARRPAAQLTETGAR